MSYVICFIWSISGTTVSFGIIKVLSYLQVYVCSFTVDQQQLHHVEEAHDDQTFKSRIIGADESWAYSSNQTSAFAMGVQALREQ